MLAALGEEVKTVTDRIERFRLTAAYRARYPGGLVWALAQHSAQVSTPQNLVFDNIRGVDECRAALLTFSNARFLFLDAPPLERLTRLVGREDVFDEVAAPRSSTTFSEQLDANEGLEPADVARTLDRLATLGVAWVEEPLPVELLKERAAPKAANILPIVADDSCFTVRDLRCELAFDTFDLLNLKTVRTGFTESAKMLELARAAGKGVIVGSQASSGLGTLHAAIFASKAGVDHPSELSFPLKLLEDTLTTPIKFRDGFLEVAGLEAYRVDETFLN